MPDYAAFFLNSTSDIVELDLLEISHPSFTQTYYIVRNDTEGVTVTLEDTTEQEFTYYPLRITPTSASDDLDQVLRIDLGDLGEIIPTELDAVAADEGFGTKPTVKYRTYRSDDLSGPMYGPITLEVVTLNFTKEGCSFEAKAPQLNTNKTGELYNLTRFPMLKGFL